MKRLSSDIAHESTTRARMRRRVTQRNRKNSRALTLERLEDRRLLAGLDLAIDDAYLSDALGNRLTDPAVGSRVYLTAEYNTENVFSPYDIRFTVDGVDHWSPSLLYGYGSAPDAFKVTSSLYSTGSGYVTDQGNGYWVVGEGLHAFSVELVGDADTSDNAFPPLLGSAVFNVTTTFHSALNETKFAQPIDGEAYVDWNLGNYMDVNGELDPRDHLDPDHPVADYRCDPKSTNEVTQCPPFTYNGHDALDIGPPNFAHQDHGIQIFAAASGVVTHAVDQHRDRNTVWCGDFPDPVVAPPANFIVIDHGNDWQTHYYHLRKESAAVSVGDVIKRGEPIALVGSSGCSTGPHLHFTVTYQGLAVETYLAPNDYWLNPVPYNGDVPPNVLDSGIADHAPDELFVLGSNAPAQLERPPEKNFFDPSEHVFFWFMPRNLHGGGQTEVVWTNPNAADTVVSVSPSIGWAYLPPPAGGRAQGQWQVKLRHRASAADPWSVLAADQFLVTQDATKLAGEFQFSSDLYYINENGKQVEITVRRSGDYGLATVDYATQSASAGASDVQSTFGTLTFQDGELEKRFTVGIIDDNLYAEEEAFQLVLNNPTGGTLGNQMSAGVIIIDDDQIVNVSSTGININAMSEPGTDPVDVLILDDVLKLLINGQVCDLPTEWLNSFSTRTLSVFVSMGGGATAISATRENLQTSITVDARGGELVVDATALPAPELTLVNLGDGTAQIRGAGFESITYGGIDSLDVRVPAGVEVQQYVVVNSLGDGGDRNPGDGICETAIGGGDCSLRAAIEETNAMPGPGMITFNFGGAGPPVIQPTTALPPISSTVHIDGARARPKPAPRVPGVPECTVDRPRTVLDGSLITDGSPGLVFTGGNNTVENLVVTNWGFPDLGAPGSTKNVPAGGIVLLGSGGNTVRNNHIGIDATGAVAQGNNFYGVYVASPNNRITGNLLSGNQGFGLHITGEDAVRNRVRGNCIGTDRTGTAAVPNTGGGVVITDFARDNLIGGSTPAARNIISGNGAAPLDPPDVPYQGFPSTPFPLSGLHGSGIHVENLNLATPEVPVPNLIQGNFIGTDITGTAPLGNANHGALLTFTNQVTVGGTLGVASPTAPGQMCTGVCNVISANASSGIGLSGHAGFATDNVVQGNNVGTDVTGTLPLGNAENGIHISNKGNTIGGSNPNEGNVIAFNNEGVIVVSDIKGLGYDGNQIRGNSIHSNALLGIDLITGQSTDGPTPNDPGDPDVGPNHNQNYPVIASAQFGAQTLVTGMLNSLANTAFMLEFFANSTADPSGFGEGERFLGSFAVTTDASGNASFNLVSLGSSVAGEWITGTATNLQTGDTSEFSGAVETKLRFELDGCTLRVFGTDRDDEVLARLIDGKLEIHDYIPPGAPVMESIAPTYDASQICNVEVQLFKGADMYVGEWLASDPLVTETNGDRRGSDPPPMKQILDPPNMKVFGGADDDRLKVLVGRRATGDATNGKTDFALLQQAFNITLLGGAGRDDTAEILFDGVWWAPDALQGPLTANVVSMEDLNVEVLESQLGGRVEVYAAVPNISTTLRNTTIAPAPARPGKPVPTVQLDYDGVEDGAFTLDTALLASSSWLRVDVCGPLPPPGNRTADGTMRYEIKDSRIEAGARAEFNSKMRQVGLIVADNTVEGELSTHSNVHLKQFDLDSKGNAILRGGSIAFEALAGGARGATSINSKHRRNDLDEGSTYDFNAAADGGEASTTINTEMVSMNLGGGSAAAFSAHVRAGGLSKMIVRDVKVNEGSRFKASNEGDLVKTEVREVRTEAGSSTSLWTHGRNELDVSDDGHVTAQGSQYHHFVNLEALGASGSVKYKNGDVAADSIARQVISGLPGTKVDCETDDGSVQVDLGGFCDFEVAVAKFYVVNPAGTSFQYDSAGNPVSNFPLANSNAQPKGAAASADNTTLWVVDQSSQVFVYDIQASPPSPAGAWVANRLVDPEGIATDDTDIWIVDDDSNTVLRYAGAAALTSGSADPVSFNLDADNGDPTGITTDGETIWVTNDPGAHGAEVFVYDTLGILNGRWPLDGDNQEPKGLTIDPSNGLPHIWVADTNGTSPGKVYQYDNAVGLTSGSPSPPTSFTLVAANTNPEGIADPPHSLSAPFELAGESNDPLENHIDEDVDGDGIISLRDALVVINHLNRHGSQAIGPAGAVDEAIRQLDVNDDQSISLLDALRIINRIIESNAGEGESIGTRPAEVESGPQRHTASSGRVADLPYVATAWDTPRLDGARHEPADLLDPADDSRSGRKVSNFAENRMAPPSHFGPRGTSGLAIDSSLGTKSHDDLDSLLQDLANDFWHGQANSNAEGPASLRRADAR